MKTETGRAQEYLEAAAAKSTGKLHVAFTVTWHEVLA